MKWEPTKPSALAMIANTPTVTHSLHTGSQLSVPETWARVLDITQESEQGVLDTDAGTGALGGFSSTHPSAMKPAPVTSVTVAKRRSINPKHDIIISYIPMTPAYSV